MSPILSSTITARVSLPGILLGSYPERQERSQSGLWPGLQQFSGPWQLARYRRFVSRMRELESALSRETPQALQQRIPALRAQLIRDGFADDSLGVAFALVSLACTRELGITPFDTQMLAARILLDNRLAEMATGEGKTLAAGIAAATAALAGVPVHLITANDYLVQRDAENLRPLYDALGIKVGMITQQMDDTARRAAYACDITYCTARELVFDYLRDQLAKPKQSDLEQRAARLCNPDAPERRLRGLCMAIIDEADSILIDEARVPLILSRSLAEGDKTDYRLGWELSAHLAPEHYILDAEMRCANLTGTGKTRLHMLNQAYPGAWLTQRHCEDVVKLALAARHLLHRGRDYLLEAGKVLIIDGTTGRAAHGRNWSGGLHQMVEIKEGCALSAPVAPLVQITFQRFFSRYLRLGGMSGTLIESRRELWRVYCVPVVKVPLRKPLRRTLLPARCFANRAAQWDATVERVCEMRALGRPVLIGTDSVMDSEALSRRLSKAGIAHTVLNASQDRQEAQIIAAAGRAGAVTVATNMAGRGTDIILDDGVAERGGLHVISCQQNISRRIDRQLVGRSARQGDPGSAEAFILLDGPLLGGRWLVRVARTCIRNGEMRPAWPAEYIWRIAQRAEERRQRHEREILLRRDKETGRWFAFSGPEI